MNTPRFILGAALLFWGWMTGLSFIAIPMALVIEASWFLKTRWDFGAKECARIWDVCVIFTAVLMVYCYSINDGQSLVLDLLRDLNISGRNTRFRASYNYYIFFFQWLPIVVYPFILVQAYGSIREHRMPTFFITLRLKSRQDAEFAQQKVNFSWIYFMVILMATASTQERDWYFFAGFSVLVGWGMFSNRPKRVSPVLWWAIFALVVKLGYLGHNGLRLGHQKLEMVFADILSQMGKGQSNGQKAVTSIGERGRMKQSGAIVARVTAPDGAPIYLREGSYSVFRGRSWYLGSEGAFEEVEAEADTFTWVLNKEISPDRDIRVSVYKAGEETILPVPHGTVVLSDFAGDGVRVNRYAAVQTVEGPSLLSYTTEFSEKRSHDSKPTYEDFQIPEDLTEVIADVARKLRLDEGTVDERLGRIFGYFASDFSYTLYQPREMSRNRMGMRPVEFFLRVRKAGHCEFFATATTLLLREAGIPSRYAAGYAVEELKDEDEREYVVRARHGHAWCLYFSEEDQLWHNFDTTPGSWLEEEREEYRSFLEPLSDFFSDLKHGFLAWRYGERSGRTQRIMMGVLLFLVVILVFRIVRGRRRIREGAGPEGPDLVVPGLDSDVYQVVRWFKDRGYARTQGETLKQWQRRLEELDVPGALLLKEIIDLHYAYRFDPKGLDEDRRQAMSDKVGLWLKEAETAVEQPA